MDDQTRYEEIIASVEKLKRDAMAWNIAAPAIQFYLEAGFLTLSGQEELKRALEHARGN